MRWQDRRKDFIIYAARPSHSCRTLADALSVRRWYEYSGVGPRVGKKLIINWGSRLSPPWLTNLRHGCTLLNRPENVALAVDKVRFFNALQERGFQDAVGHTTDIAVARVWQGMGRTVVERAITDGRSGRGIRVVEPGRELSDRPLYTRYYGKTHEIRIHIFRGRCLHVSEKRRRTSDPEGVLDNYCRTAARGWVFSDTLSTEMEILRPVIERGREALHLLGLDFGACDFLLKLAPGEDGNRRLRGFKLCEINTAPGIENTSTRIAWTNALSDYYINEFKQ